MRRSILFLFAACVGLVGCGESAVAPVDETARPTAAQLDSHAETVPVIWTADGQPTGGQSKLTRTPNGVNYRVQTEGLEPGHAHTLWIVIFNNPDGCLSGIPGVTSCGPADVVNDAARPDMMWAAGNIVGGSGRTTLAGRRSVADQSRSANAPVGLPAYGLETPEGAEFHLVVHDHGPVLPSYMPDMIQSIDGGCTDAGVPAAGVPSPWNDYAGPPMGAFARRGPNTCASVQVALHAAP